MTTSYLDKLRLFSRDVRLYFLGAALVGLTNDGIRAVVYNLYLLRLGYDAEFIGWVNAVGSVAFVIASLIPVVLDASSNSHRGVSLGISVMALGNGLMLLVESMPFSWQAPWIMATSALAMIGMAFFFVYGTPFLMGAIGADARDHGFSMQMAVPPLAGFAGGLLGGALPELFAGVLGVSLEDPTPYRYALIIATAILAAGTLVTMLMRKPSVQITQQHLSNGNRIPYAALIFVGLVSLLRFAGQFVVMTFFSVYLDDSLGVSTALIGALWAAAKLLSVPAALMAPLVVVRWGRYRTIVLGSLAMAASILLVAFIPHWSGAGLGLIGVMALFAMTTAPLNVYSQEIVAERWRAGMAAAAMVGSGACAALMAFGSGQIITTLGYSSIFALSAGLTGMGGLVFGALGRARLVLDKSQPIDTGYPVPEVKS